MIILNFSVQFSSHFFKLNKKKYMSEKQKAKIKNLLKMSWLQSKYRKKC